MTNIAVQPPSADDVMNEAIVRSFHGTEPLIVVKSPPGAGKTFLVECAIAAAVTAGKRALCITPGVSQLYDIAERLLPYQLPQLALMHAGHRSLPPRLNNSGINVVDTWDPAFDRGPMALITNAHKISYYLDRVQPNSFDVLIIDEAYQLAAKDFLPISDMAPRILMVGDPGQLPPVNSVDTSNLEVGEYRMHWSAPAEVLRRLPATPVLGLPTTRRLLPDSARLVQRAFYPELPFASAVAADERQLRFGSPGIDRVADKALDAIAAGASLVAIALPGAAPAHEEADMELAAVMARIARHVMDRRAAWYGSHELTQADIGCIEPHRVAGGAISEQLRRAGLNEVRVDTVERWQGLQVPISIVRHPLSIPGRPTSFDLQAGRWCVALSRHQLGCIIVTRNSVGDTLRDYVHPCDSAAAGAADEVWSGYEAHRLIWSELERQKRIFRS